MRRRWGAVIVSLHVVLLLTQAPPTCLGAAEEDASVPIRIGWQMPAVTQAAIVQVFKRTDVLARHGFDPSLVPFSYGTPQIEAAFAGKLDVLFAGDQPAINLVAGGGKWTIVGRIFYDRNATIVSASSPIRELAELKGKTVGSPFGSVAHREALLHQQAAGLDPDADVQNLDLDILEIRRRVLSGESGEWDGIDAAAVWEPSVSSFERAGLARVLAETHTLGVVAMSDEFIARSPEAAVQFLAALIRAWLFFAQHTDRVMRWYNDDTHLDFDQEVLISAVEIDPNVHAGSLEEISLDLTEVHLATLERNAAWGVEEWPDGSPIRRFVDRDLLARAKQLVAGSQFEDPNVILPSIRAVSSGPSRVGFGLDSIPLAVVFVMMVLVALTGIELGYLMGRRMQDESSRDMARPVGTVGAAVLGMMAFVIAITFGSATSRFDARKTALLEDVTAIQTAYLQSGLLPEPHRTTMQSLLRDYVQARAGIVQAYGQPETLRLVERHAATLQALMWSHVEEMAEEPGGGSYASFASALNGMFGLHTKRVALGAYYRIPGFMWWAIIFASAVAMVAVGFQFGIVGSRRVIPVRIALAMTFALVMVLAIDLDRAGEGMIAVNQKPMIDLYQSLSRGR